MKPEPPVVTVTLNPAIDLTLSIPGFAAGQVNRAAESWSNPGGKGVNVACFLADLGIDVTVTGFLGMDNMEVFNRLFQHKGINDMFVPIEGETRTGIKIIDPVTRETTDINLPGLVPGQEDLEQLFEFIADLAEPGGWFVLSGSVPVGLPEDIYATLIDKIHGQGERVLLDTSGRPLREALRSRPDVMKPNVEELAELMGRALETPRAVRAAAESLLERGAQRVVVSMGARGAVFVEQGAALLAKPPRVEVRSTVGAGDAMVGGIVAALLQDLPLEEIARRATAGGAYAVMHLGAGIENLSEYRDLIEKVEIEPLE